MQDDYLGPGYADFMGRFKDPDFPDVSSPDHARCHAVNGCPLSMGTNRTYYLSSGDYFLETQLGTNIGR